MLPDPTWTRGTSSPQRSEGLHEAVARTALSRPDAVALLAGDRRVSYAELDGTAGAWAARLAAAGAGPGRYVPILLPRGVELVTALLAVLQTGAAYALLDPAWPDRRVQEVLDQLRPPLLVGTGDRPGVPVWTPPAGPVPAAERFRPVSVRGTDPCCVFFTSGTTGRPKGVVSPHRATARLFPPGGFARFAADTVMPLAAALPWDAFSLELWSVLLAGGTSLVVEEPFLTADALRAAVSRQGADTVWLTSSLFDLIVDEDPDAFRGLRQVLTGGERLSTAHVARFLARNPDVALLNGYGPVESTVFATTHRIVPADCDRPGGIPLGRPVPGTQVYVLDGERPCAVGETGEICVAGEGLALGYLGDPGLTADKFREVPVGGATVRMFRTGDLGCWDAGGLLHFGGRADRQVKIRGHRVEPVEVERQVEQLLPSVRSCRVVARRDRRGVPRELVAFCVPAKRGDELAGAGPALRSALVPYQRPAAVVAVDTFPVTPQGKLDERALLAAAPADPAPAPAAPARGTAGLVAETFAAVLGRRPAGPDVPLVELGGTSLDAGRVAARLATALGRPVPVSRLHQHPTPAALARWLDGSAAAGGTATPADREPAGPGGVPLTPMQLVYLTRHLAAPGDRTAHCLLGWVVEGELDAGRLHAAVAAVHDRHEPLRAAYLPDPQPSAVPVDVPPPPLEVLSAAPSVDVALRRMRAELAGDLDPTGADVWRTMLVPVEGEPRAVFGCVLHHLVFDGWSESVLAADLSAAYAGQDLPAAPPLARQHRAYAQRLAHVDLAGQAERLAAELRGTPELSWPAGPTDPAPAAPARLEATLGPAAVGAVDALAAEAGVTRFAVLLAHCARSIAEVTGQQDFAAGVPVAQRDGEGLQRAIGCHLATVPVRLRGAVLAGGPEAARAAGRLARDALAAQDVPFEEVLRRLDPARTGRPPLYQVLFALQDNAVPRLELPGLRTAFVRQPYLELPLELHAELWPEDGGSLRLVVSWRPELVPDGAAQDFAKHVVSLATEAEGRP